MKHYIIYAKGPKGSIKTDDEIGCLFLEKTLASQQIRQQIIEKGEMTPKEAANKCMMAYVQVIRTPGLIGDPVEVHLYLGKDGYAVAFTARCSDGSEIIVCRGCEQL